ncbi:alkaline phosphatase [Albibacterium sp.]|uniref:alkaline phosphatase n=1 Tax=Albibacterium sp. TaxID=2952885 RepID=UPI002C039043|nr:alkaline phosphatase [Albibacterium sp.]HUH18514.1 alkaline phosphatase [Albibacterium sp.]
MKRRSFFKKASLAVASASVLSPFDLLASEQNRSILKNNVGSVKNIIFMVSDGMSIGTLTMADLLLQRREGRRSKWLSLYDEGKVTRALMDTASANALVTDSAAASSAWGGGKRVNNGSLNVNPDGSFNKPILQKFKSAGKSVGCVTSVPVTHATPAGFCVNSASRDNQSDIAVQYLKLEFDVLLGGGTEFFSADKRMDKANLFGQFSQKGYHVVQDRNSLLQTSTSKPLLGVFHEDGLPYTLDVQFNRKLKAEIPSLSEMTRQAINRLKQNKNGFVLQVEGGSVDWAAHANDASALLYEQIAFDEALAEAISFAEQDGETLVIITTDHGNANPGLFSSNDKFDKIQHFQQTNNKVLNSITRNFNAKQVIDYIESAQGIVIKNEEAKDILKHYNQLDSEGLYNPNHLPFKTYAEIQSNYTGISFASTNHSADLVELAMFGPGSESLPQFVKNIDLHNFMLQAAELDR